MRAPDLLDSIREQLRVRLGELRPLVSEYERLLQAERALSARVDGEQQSRLPRRGARQPSGDASDRAVARERLLALVRERPGVTKGELHVASGLSAAAVAQQVRRLRDSGQIGETQLPSGELGYRVASVAEDRATT